MTTPEQRFEVLAEVRRLLARARKDQIDRLLSDIRRSAPIQLEERA